MLNDCRTSIAPEINEEAPKSAEYLGWFAPQILLTFVIQIREIKKFWAQYPDGSSG